MKLLPLRATNCNQPDWRSQHRNSAHYQTYAGGTLLPHPSQCGWNTGQYCRHNHPILHPRPHSPLPFTFRIRALFQNTLSAGLLTNPCRNLCDDNNGISSTVMESSACAVSFMMSRSISRSPSGTGTVYTVAAGSTNGLVGGTASAGFEASCRASACAAC